MLPIQETVFSPDELADLHALAEDARPERAIHLWTLKESFIKARSMGLSLPLKRFSMRFGAGAGGAGVGIDIHPSIAVPGENWQFALHRLATDHVVALTMARGPTGRDKEVTFHDVIPLEDLASKGDSEVP